MVQPPSLLARRQVPQAKGLLGPLLLVGQPLAVRREALDAPLTGVEPARLLARRDVPEADRAVAAPADQRRAAGGEGDAPDAPLEAVPGRLVADEAADLLA